MPDSTLNRVYGAVADPTRRAILSTLMHGSATVGTIAAGFPMSLNAVSKHLKVLERAGLVARRIDGNQHWLELRAAPMREATDWLDRYRLFWENTLEALETMLLEQRRRTPTRGSRRKRRR